MSLYGMMRTGVSGMNAQANRLSAVADNIANSGTTGYKRSGTEFSSLLMPNVTGNYTSGGVTTTVRYAISQQGDLKYTSSGSDLAINGDGFFVVQDPSGQSFLTRAGSFVPDGNGKLVNAAGFTLMGYDASNGTPSVVANGFGGLVPVTISDQEFTAVPSTNGLYTANLPADATAVTDPADLPSANNASATYTAKTSLTAYDNLGKEVLLDVYFTKTADNTWEVAIFDKSTAGATTTFPYAASGFLGSQTLDFDGTTGKLTTTSATDITVTVPNGQSLTIDLAKMTQLSGDYQQFDAEVDGNAPSGIDQIQIDDDGTVYAQYENGSFKALYRIPLASVPSPDRLTVEPGNVFSQSADSGDIIMGFPNEGSMGSVVSGALENSNVDVAEELTNMIESQRSYTANSKVFQTGADLMDILVNLKR
jgi:flagellar hook protein FlgE